LLDLLSASFSEARPQSLPVLWVRVTKRPLSRVRALASIAAWTAPRVFQLAQWPSEAVPASCVLLPAFCSLPACATWVLAMSLLCCSSPLCLSLGQHPACHRVELIPTFGLRRCQIFGPAVLRCCLICATDLWFWVGQLCGIRCR
jgi:hypothetical protein